MSVFERIDEISGRDGFWKSRTRETLVEQAKKLQAIGMGDDEIYELLDAVFWAAAGEFGN